MDAGAILDLEGAEQLSVLSPLPANSVRHPILVRLFQREDSIFLPTAQNPMNTALQPGLLLLDLSVPIVRLHDFDLALRALPQLRESRLSRILGVRATHRLSENSWPGAGQFALCRARLDKFWAEVSNSTRKVSWG